MIEWAPTESDEVEKPAVALGPGAAEGEATHPLRVAYGDLHGDGATHGVPDHVRLRDAKVIEHGRGIVGHLARGVRGRLGHVRLPHPAVVEGHHPVVRRQSLDLKEPVRRGSGESIDEQEGIALPLCLVVEADPVQRGVRHTWRPFRIR